MFTNADDAATYTIAGNATLTLESAKTGVRYTFKVKAPKKNDNNVRFVSLLSGPNNTSDYTYLGMLKSDGSFALTKASKATDDSLPVKAFRFFTQNVLQHKHLPNALHVWHEGTCGRCGRVLTVPDSIDRGIGPECIKHL